MTQGLYIYLSGADEMATTVNDYAAELRAAGHQVTSAWHEPGGTWGKLGSMELVPVIREAQRNVLDSTLVVAFIGHGNRDRSLFELGLAHGRGIACHLIGRPVKRAYDLHPDLNRWQTWQHFRRGSALFPEPPKLGWI